MADSLLGEYTAECTFPSCVGKLRFQYPAASRLRPGDIVPFDSSRPDFGKCPLCKRNAMRVQTAPSQPLPSPPVGFSEIPTT